MHSHGRLARLGLWLATTSLSLGASAPALAQPAPPPGAGQPGAEQAGNQGADPPALAGRLAGLTGSVSFHTSDQTQWSAATLNYPVTNGDAFWTEPGAQARLEIADDRLVMDASTELDVTALDQAQIAATEAQGAIFLQLASLPAGQAVTFTTPRGAVQITAPGRYEIVAGDTNDATTVTVVEGAAHVAGTNLALDIGPQQTATIGGSDTLQGSVGAIQQDAFLRSMLAAPVRPHFDAAVPRQVQYMTGASDLQAYGSFSQTAQYGQVWYPHDVASNWAPYRDGHWAYVQPWGWTWVDNARWGFAPFHYGRWVQVENRWGWVAGGGGEVAEGSPYPVYSPALVSFVGVGAAALAGASIGFAAGEIGSGYAPAWIPLGPREPYYPWYHCRPDYFGRINAPYGVPRTIIERGPVYNTNITNIRTINNNRTTIFINQRAATVIPAAAFARGASVASLGRPLPERALLDARPVVGRLPVRPTAETANLPQAAARRYNVALRTAPVRPVTAGPQIVRASAQARSVPELRRAALPADVRGVPATRVPGMKLPPAGGPQPPRGPAQTPALRPEIRPGVVASPVDHAALRPAAGPHAAAALPTLRAPGAARPEPVRAAPAAGRPGEPMPKAGDHQPATRPNLPPVVSRSPAPSAPIKPGHPEQSSGVHPSAPIEHHAAAGPAIEAKQPVPEASHPAHLQQPATPRPMPRAVAPRPAPMAHVQAPRPAPMPHVQAPRPAPMPHVQAPRPAPVHQAPPPAAPRMQAPRPAPRIEAPRPAPRVEAPRPQPAPPRPAAPPPRPAAPAPNPLPIPASIRPDRPSSHARASIARAAAHISDGRYGLPMINSLEGSTAPTLSGRPVM